MNKGASGVTVAIACYNQAHFLADAIESVLVQTLPADAIIIVDDGSRDATAQVAALYPAVRYHRQDNAGLSAARNTGLALAESAHILFLDADDMLRPTALEMALARMAAAPGLALVYGGYRNVTATREVMAEYWPVQRDDAFTALLHDNFIGMHGTVVYNTALLREIGGFDAGLASCEDWDVYLRLARHHPIAAYDAIGADYRRHTTNMSADTARMIAMTRTVLERQLAEGLTPTQQAAARQGIAFSRRHHALKLIGDLNASISAAGRTLSTGFRNDPLFGLRLVAATARAATRRLGFSRPSPPARR